MVKYQAPSLDRTFGALADPTRRHILEELAQGERCVTDLARPYRMSLPAVSKHLRVLEAAGLVRRQRCGRVHRLKLEARPMQKAQHWIEEYRRFWEASFDRLDAYLAEVQKSGMKPGHQKLNTDKNAAEEIVPGSKTRKSAAIPPKKRTKI